MLEIMNDDDELMEKRIELRQNLKSKLLTLSPSRHLLNSSNNFIPYSRDIDFVEKQGLDCVMNYLNNNSNEFNEHVPYICSSCRLDSTQNWWCSVSDDNKQSIYLCDQCDQIRVRRLIIQQHRESMKSAFLQAKESERRLEVDYQKQGLNKSRRSTPYSIKKSSCKTTKL